MVVAALEVLAPEGVATAPVGSPAGGADTLAGQRWRLLRERWRWWWASSRRWPGCGPGWRRCPTVTWLVVALSSLLAELTRRYEAWPAGWPPPRRWAAAGFRRRRSWWSSTAGSPGCVMTWLRARRHVRVFGAGRSRLASLVDGLSDRLGDVRGRVREVAGLADALRPRVGGGWLAEVVGFVGGGFVQAVVAADEALQAVALQSVALQGDEGGWYRSWLTGQVAALVTGVGALLDQSRAEPGSGGEAGLRQLSGLRRQARELTRAAALVSRLVGEGISTVEPDGL